MSMPYDICRASKDLDSLGTVYTQFYNKINNAVSKKTPNRYFTNISPQRGEMLHWHDMLILEDQLEKLDFIKKNILKMLVHFLKY